MGLISNGTTIFDNGSMASGFGADLKFISKATASASASIEFTSGIDSTYKEYVFKFVNIHAQTDQANFTFQTSINGGSSYGVTATNTLFRAIHNETGSATDLSYQSTDDFAQSTSFLKIIGYASNVSSHSCNGTLQLFNPSSTTFVKHYISRTSSNHNSTGTYYQFDYYSAGYFNDGANDINAVKFQFDSGNIDSGDILLFGIN
jgi:hypothetical protein